MLRNARPTVSATAEADTKVFNWHFFQSGRGFHNPILSSAPRAPLARVSNGAGSHSARIPRRSQAGGSKDGGAPGQDDAGYGLYIIDGSIQPTAHELLEGYYQVHCSYLGPELCKTQTMQLTLHETHQLVPPIIP